MATVAHAWPPAQTIDEVIDRLDQILLWARGERSRLGYFAALYRAVTVRVRDDIALGRFEDGPRMERLDVAFANYYLAALDRFQRGQPPGLAWQAAFHAASRWRPIVLQHLLVGMNAHINLDLAVACALTSPGDSLPALRRDFDAINDILCAMIDDVQDQLARVWPHLHWLDRFGARTDEEILHFSLRVARAKAWRAAERLALLGPEAMEPELQRQDRVVALLAHAILHPGLKLSLLNLAIRLREPRDVPSVIDILT